MADNKRMKNSVYGIKTPSFLQYVLCYALWIVMAAGTVYLLLQVQINLITPIRLTSIDYRMVSVINLFTIFITGVIGLVTIILLEHFLRTRLGTRKFWPTVARTVVIEAIILAVSYAIMYILPRILPS
jgi:hypothetical protein